jgi:hypothetical protein
MEFRLTYDGILLGDRTDKSAQKRSLHKHDLRKNFHKQLQALWRKHPTLAEHAALMRRTTDGPMQIYPRDGFNWLPLVTNANGLICMLDILMLREGAPGRVVTDIDNRLKTLFDALRMASGGIELGSGTPEGQRTPEVDQDPFYVLLEDDHLITHVAVTTDMLLEPVNDTPPENAVRLVINVTVRPYRSTMDNADFA